MTTPVFSPTICFTIFEIMLQKGFFVWAHQGSNRGMLARSQKIQIWVFGLRFARSVFFFLDFGIWVLGISVLGAFLLGVLETLESLGGGSTCRRSYVNMFNEKRRYGKLQRKNRNKKRLGWSNFKMTLYIAFVVTSIILDSVLDFKRFP